MLIITIAAWALVIFALAIYRPAWAVWAVIIGSPLYLLRTDILGIPTTALELGIYAVAIIFAINWARQDKLATKLLNFYNLFKSYRWPLLIWLGFTLLSAILSPEWRLSFGILKGWFFDPLLLVLLLTSLENNEDVLNPKSVAAYGLIGAGTIIAAYGIYDYIFGYTFETGRLDAFYTSPNYAAMFLGPALVVSLAMLKQKWESRYKIPLIITTSLIFIALLMTRSFGGYVAILISLLIGTAVSNLAVRWRAALASALIIAAGLALMAGAIQLSGHYNNFYRVGSWQIRNELWRAAAAMIKQKPLTGVGLGYFQRELPRLRVSRPDLFQLKSELLKFHLPHNLYLTVAAESGVLALLGFVWFVGQWLYLARRSYKMTNEIIILGYLAAMMVILVHGLVDTTYFKNDLAVLFWLIISMALLTAPSRVTAVPR